MNDPQATRRAISAMSNEDLAVGLGKLAEDIILAVEGLDDQSSYTNTIAAWCVEEAVERLTRKEGS